MKKNDATKKVLDKLKNCFGAMNLYDFYKFITLSNYFASRGFKITLENKEDVMLEIITSPDSDADLISKLEQYLILCESNVSSGIPRYEKYSQFLKMIDTLEDEKEIKEQTDIFLSYFN